ncbi:hypothetical protein SAMN05880574_10692 [Chryseobacterium sp. RU37D]|uniref:hypothetical protein n=1 Tax=Chryseobacterium sp. RU37D TaxID=1907397 RepID=UPI0009564423|nr:hypothetical protein [Chryseobacterium sp. RU37D]SIQ13989.1 hypothetical protein SAMN05880574_10692 [Chryseobacterium sp. RU37D]
MEKKISFLFILLISFFNAQTITFISERTNKPLPKVSVFGKDGNILAYSDIDGKIDKQSLKPEQEKFQLIYNNFPVATLSYADFNQHVIKIIDNVKDIETVVIKNSKPSKYIFVKGNFNSYVTVNNRLSSFTDGIVTYIFDNKTKKLKSSRIEQYRVFRLQNLLEDRKKTDSWDYNTFLKIPEIEDVANIDDYKENKKTKFTQLKGDRKDEIEITGEALQKKEFALFGYRFFDFKSILNIAYEKNSPKTIKDLLEYNKILFLHLKHKTEPNYNTIIVYENFYPTEISFRNENNLEKIKFDTYSSHYITEYWKDPEFQNMQNIFSSYFGTDLKEQQNEK